MTATNTATAAQVRAYFKAQGNEVRISRDGRVACRPDRDYHPGAAQHWRDGGYVSDYRVDADGNIHLR